MASVDKILWWAVGMGQWVEIRAGHTRPKREETTAHFKVDRKTLHIRVISTRGPKVQGIVSSHVWATLTKETPPARGSFQEIPVAKLAAIKKEINK